MTPLSGSRILVPLDGSAAAEHALRPAARIARATGGSLVLVRIIPLRTWSVGGTGTALPEDMYQRLVDEEDQVTRDYLARMAEDLSAQGVAAQTHTERGEAGDLLLRLEQRFHVGLVVMTTHGRTGMARIALGSIADRVVRGGSAPVLLVRPFAAASLNSSSLESALVPLDGSAVSETALDVVEQLAGTLLRHVTLLRVVNAAEAASARVDAQQYLDTQRLKLVARLDRRPCEVTAAVATGDATHSILVQASHHHDVIIMATRGETGVRRWALGSVADGVMHDTPVPLLLAHPTPQSGEPAAYGAAETKRVGTP